MNKLAALLLVGVVAYAALATFLSDAPGRGLQDHQGPSLLGQAYLEKSVSARTGQARAQLENGAANVVTAIVVDYRGFDTLGEVTVLFAAVAGLGLLLGRRRRRKRFAPSPVLAATSPWLLFFILLTGLYVIAHGHLTPGGGFPGGAMLAAGFALLLVGVRPRSRPLLMKALESLAGIGLVVVGLAGLFLRGHFLENFWGPGELGTLFSGGFIALVYGLVGLKVAAELSSAVHELDEEEEAA